MLRIWTRTWMLRTRTQTWMLRTRSWSWTWKGGLNNNTGRHVHENFEFLCFQQNGVR